MRPLSEDEVQIVLKKLASYIGDKVLQMVENNQSGQHYFRLHNERVYYIRLQWDIHFYENILKYVGSISSKKLISAGVCLGKFTKSKQFRLHITALEYLSYYSKNKVWLKMDQPFLYGGNVLKKHVDQISEGIEQNAGVVVMSKNIPLGFGITSKSTENLRNSLPDDIAVINQVINISKKLC
uniref:60S ribosome subunit biogenesis protein NIP7 homolog n=1 Tax=Theileria annulata TaxID=5874 RepID=A0A3B0NBI2_THEAN